MFCIVASFCIHWFLTAFRVNSVPPACTLWCRPCVSSMEKRLPVDSAEYGALLFNTVEQHRCRNPSRISEVQAAPVASHQSLRQVWNTGCWCLLIWSYSIIAYMTSQINHLVLQLWSIGILWKSLCAVVKCCGCFMKIENSQDWVNFQCLTHHHYCGMGTGARHWGTRLPSYWARGGSTNLLSNQQNAEKKQHLGHLARYEGSSFGGERPDHKIFL